MGHSSSEGIDARMAQDHIDRFNAGVRAGDFSGLVGALAPDAVMEVGLPVPSSAVTPSQPHTRISHPTMKS